MTGRGVAGAPPAGSGAPSGSAQPVTRAGPSERREVSSPASLYARWVPACAAAELLGIAAGALWWVAMDRISPDPVLRGEKLLMLCLKALAGLPEGLVLATMQAAVLRRRYPRLPVRLWVILTIAVAALGWAAGSAVPIFGSVPANEAVEPPLGLVVLFASALGLSIGAVFGAAQALALRKTAKGSGWWILANALGWALALPIVYAAAGLFDEVPSAAAILASGLGAGSATGLLLGATTGLAFWRMAPLSSVSGNGLR